MNLRDLSLSVCGQKRLFLGTAKPPQCPGRCRQRVPRLGRVQVSDRDHMPEHAVKTVSWSQTAQNCSAPAHAADYFQFEIGGVSVRLSGARFSCDLAPGLKLFCAATGAPDIRLKVIWLPRLNLISARPLFDSGMTWRVYQSEAGFQFDFSAPALGREPYKRLMTDRHFRRATLELSDEFFACSPAASALDYPLDELLIMHRLTQEKAIELHGTGIVRPNGEANLFVGHSGAGKSTTTRLWTALEDVEVLSDDRIIVRRDSDASVVAIPCNASSSASNRVLRSAQDDKKYKMRMYGTPWHGEAMYASPNSAPLTRIFVLEHGHGNVVAPLSPPRAVAELFARCFVPFHRLEYVDSALEFRQELVHAVPVYRYAFEPDPRAVEKIRNCHD